MTYAAPTIQDKEGLPLQLHVPCSYLSHKLI